MKKRGGAGRCCCGPTATSNCIPDICDEAAARDLQVTIAGFSGANSCCSGLNGVYTLTPDNLPNDGTCRWTYSSTACGGFTDSFTIEVELSWTGALTCEIRASLGGFPEVYYFAIFSTTIAVPYQCDSLSESLTFSSEQSGTTGFDCNQSSATCDLLML